MSFSGLAALAMAVFATEGKGSELTVGDPAPPLAVSKWVKGEPIKRIEPGKTYVVEFWATWCAPCIECIPHLTELQKKYEGRVTFLGVSVAEEDQTKVEPFVETMGDKMVYAVALDEVGAGDTHGHDGTMFKSWLNAADESTIPKAFIVDGGKIAWIGRPDALEEPLMQVLSGQRDLEVAARERRRKKEVVRKTKVIWPEIERTVRDGWPTEESLAIVEKAIADDPALETGELGRMKFQFLLTTGHVEEASLYGARLVESIYKDHARTLNYLAWLIVNNTPSRAMDKRDLKLALRAVERAKALSHGADYRILDTSAQVYFAMGDAAKALATSQTAVELAGEKADAEMRGHLETYRKAVSKPAP